MWVLYDVGWDMVIGVFGDGYIIVFIRRYEVFKGSIYIGIERDSGNVRFF